MDHLTTLEAACTIFRIKLGKGLTAVRSKLRNMENTHLFYKKPFFSTQPQVLLNFSMSLALNAALVLLNKYKHHHTDALFIFSIIVPMSRNRYIYVVSM